MNTEPNAQRKIYGLDYYFNEIVDLYNNNKLPNKFLLSGPKGNGKSTLAYHIINYIFSKNETNPYNFEQKEISDQNRSFKLFQNFSHPDFYLINLKEDKRDIEISQVRKMINYTNKSSFNDRPRFILIDNAEHLNISSVNALLKVIEEPNDNLFFILIHNNKKSLIKTLKSRCLLFKINLTFDESTSITNQLLNNNLFDLINNDLINYYNSPGDYVNLVKFSEENKINLKEFNLREFLIFVIDEGYYKKNNFIKSNIFNFIELYFLKIFHQSINKNIFISFYAKFIRKIDDVRKYNLDYESLFIEFKSKFLNG